MKNPERKEFQKKEIFEKVIELGLLNATESTLSTHISSMCVANRPAQPDTHRKLYRVANGWFRLFRPGDDYHPSRENGKIEPLSDQIPEKFHNLLSWYRDEYCKSANPQKVSIQNLPFTRIETNGLVKFPSKILKKMKLQEGDYIAFVENSNGEITLKRAKIQVEVS